jgi:hypothetical protein
VAGVSHDSDDASTGCFTLLQISAGGGLSNVVSAPVAAAGERACSDAALPASVLAKLDSGGDIYTATFALARLGDTDGSTLQQVASGSAGRHKAAKFVLPYTGPHFGFGYVYDRTYPVNTADPASPEATLDAGAQLPLGWPNLPGSA